MSDAVIDCIRQKIRVDSHESGYKQGVTESRQKYELEKREQINRACKRAEDEIENEFAEKEKIAIKKIKVMSAFIAILFVVATVASFLSQIGGSVKWAVLVVTIVSTIQAVQPFSARIIG